MSNYRRKQRKEEIRLVRENARNAFYSGKSIHSCPYQYCDQYQWEDEFLMLESMEKEKKRIVLREILSGATSVEDIKKYLLLSGDSK
jgi:hypothetical protein